MNIISDLKKLRCGKIIENIDLKKYTTYKVGGRALVIAYPDSIDNLKKLIKYIKDNNIKHKIIGNGSNLIFSEEFYDGILIKLEELNKLEIKGNLVTVGAGYNLIKLCIKVANS